MVNENQWKDFRIVNHKVRDVHTRSARPIGQQIHRSIGPYRPADPDQVRLRAICLQTHNNGHRPGPQTDRGLLSHWACCMVEVRPFLYSDEMNTSNIRNTCGRAGGSERQRSIRCEIKRKRNATKSAPQKCQHVLATGQKVSGLTTESTLTSGSKMSG